MSESEATIQRLQYLVESIRDATNELDSIIPGGVIAVEDSVILGQLSIHVVKGAFRDVLPVQCVRRRPNGEKSRYPLEILCTIGPATFFALVDEADLSAIPVPSSALVEPGVLIAQPGGEQTW